MKRSLDTCLIQNTKNTEGGHRCKKNRRNDALNKAVIPAILVLLCIGVRCSAWLQFMRFFSREADSTGMQPVNHATAVVIS